MLRSISILSLAVMLSMGTLAQKKYMPSDVHMTLDYSKYKGGASLNGPAFGVSWLMQNRFINTFDFAVAKNNQRISLAPDKLVTLRYQFMYMPENTIGKLKTGIGLGVNHQLDNGNGNLGLNMLGKIKYPLTQSYFVELIIPYNIYYKSFGEYGLDREMQQSKFKTFKGLDIKTNQFSSVRVGVGVKF